MNHRADLRKAGDKAPELYRQLEAEYTNLQHPLRVSTKFGVEEIIDPAHTRLVVCEWTTHMYFLLSRCSVSHSDSSYRYQDTLKERLQERATGKLKPSFR